LIFLIYLKLNSMNWRVNKIVLAFKIICLLIVGVSFTNCESNDLENSFKTSLCVVKQASGSSSSYLLLDNGAILNSDVVLDSTLYLANTRYLVTFILLDESVQSIDSAIEYPVKILEMQPVLIKTIVPMADTLSVSDADPVNIQKTPWFGGGYINIDFIFRFYETTSKHKIWLTADSLVQEGDKTYYYMSFVHHAAGDLTTNISSSLLSFDYADMTSLSQADSIRLVVKEWTTSGTTTISEYTFSTEH
jgi:hypothetical protein